MFEHDKQLLSATNIHTLLKSQMIKLKNLIISLSYWDGIIILIIIIYYKQYMRQDECDLMNLEL